MVLNRSHNFVQRVSDEGDASVGFDPGDELKLVGTWASSWLFDFDGCEESLRGTRDNVRNPFLSTWERDVASVFFFDSDIAMFEDYILF